MKAVAQKPIQSLHAFGRHLNGGSIAALPLLIHTACRAIFPGFIIGMLLVFSAAAQQRDTNRQSADEQRLDLLFDGIMQSLPDEMRMKVDSAAAVKVERRTPTEATPSGQDRMRQHGSDQARLQELPDELKVQVERAIADMDKRKEERKAQFRESRRNR